MIPLLKVTSFCALMFSNQCCLCCQCKAVKDIENGGFVYLHHLANCEATKLVLYKFDCRTVQKSLTMKPRQEPILKRLQWLPIHHWVTCKMATFVYNIRRNREPDNLFSLLEDYIPRWQIVSSKIHCLNVLRTKLKTGEQAFCIVTHGMLCHREQSSGDSYIFL